MLIDTLGTNPLFFLRIIVIVIFSISLHELAHGFAALSQGDDTPKKTGHMTLNPIVHMGWQSMIFLCLAGIAWGQMPVNPSRFRHKKLSNIFVSAAGPLLNLGLGILFLSLLYFNFVFADGKILSFQFLYLASSVNFRLFLFNLLPIPPLDGFHIFSEIFPQLKSLENSPFGLFALAILFFGGFSSILSFLSNAIICQAVPYLRVCGTFF